MISRSDGPYPRIKNNAKQNGDSGKETLVGCPAVWLNLG